MRKQSSVGWPLAALLTLAAAPGGAQGQGVAAVLAQQERALVVVILKHSGWPADVEEQKALAAALQDEALRGELSQGFTLLRRFETVPALTGWIEKDAYEQAMAMRAQGRGVVSGIDLDEAGTGETPRPEQGGSGGLTASVPLIRADLVHASGIRGNGVEVAILDTGLDRSHLDLQSDLVAEQCFCFNPTANCCPNGASTQSGAGSAQDDHGHGTHVAGIVGSDGAVSGVGVAPAAKLTMVKMLDKNNSFYSTSDIVAGLDWLNVNRPQVKVVSMSLYTNMKFSGVCDTSTSWTQALYQAAQNLVQKGVVLVAIAGNDALVGQVPAPGCLSNVTMVGATTKSDQAASFSNSHPDVDFFAPGVSIVSDKLGGGTATLSGTSMACPHVSGLLALMIEAAPAVGRSALLSAISSTGIAVNDGRGLTRPRIDAKAAVDSVKPATLPTLGIDDRTVAEGSAVNAAFRVFLSAASAQTVTVQYATANNSALAGSDYTAASGTLSLSPGRTQHSIFVPIATDGTPEGSEAFFVNLSSPQNATLADAQAVGTIQDPPAAAKIAMYRSYNKSTDYHFFTTDLNSKNFAVGTLGFQDESNPVPFYVWNSSQPGTTGLFRMYNPNLGRHFYTASSGSRDFIMGIGGVYEKEEGFVFPLATSPVPSGATELFLLYNNNSGTHLFTADAGQKDAILSMFPGVWVQHTSVGYVFTSP